MTDIDDLTARFIACTLPKSEWTHAAHLTVGTWHVTRFGAAEALHRMRTGIRRLNDAHGTVNSASSGYHETITRAYIELIASFLAACPPGTSLAHAVDALLAGPLGDRQVLGLFYSRDRLMSVEARAAWVEPDLTPLALPSGAVSGTGAARC